VTVHPICEPRPFSYQLQNRDACGHHRVTLSGHERGLTVDEAGLTSAPTIKITGQLCNFHVSSQGLFGLRWLGFRRLLREIALRPSTSMGGVSLDPPLSFGGRKDHILSGLGISLGAELSPRAVCAPMAVVSQYDNRI
jgi:hypothetical protein